MYDYADATAFANLDRELVKILAGENETGGLYRGLLGAPDWGQVQYTKGMIVAYESVRKIMEEIATRMDRGDSNARQYGRTN